VAQFDMRGQRVTNQYNAGRDINFGAVQTPDDLIALLEQLNGQVTQAQEAGGAISYEMSVGLYAMAQPLLPPLSGAISYKMNVASSFVQLIGLVVGLSFGLSTGLLVGLLNGGLACLRHWVLRFLLWRAGAVPWHYVQFLDYAAERILLRKVGGGYIFIHRLLLDYFADLETGPVLDEVAERRQTNIPAPVSPSNMSSEPTVPAILPDLSSPMISLAPPAALSEAPRSLPCGHELPTPSARFCSICGASITMSHTPT
jgi:hypothetical protein